jgi:hypothetical protein
MKRILCLTVLAGLVSACTPGSEQTTETAQTASAVPSEAGVCWRLGKGAPAVLDRVDNLPTCAQRLEAVRMMEGGAVEGAFEGRTISVTEAEIDQGKPGGDRYPVFTTGQRAEMQAAIQALLDRRGEGGRS